MIEKIIFIILTIGSLFLAREAIWKFQTSHSSFTTSELPITERPTITICLPYQFQNYTYGMDFNITKYFLLSDYMDKKNEVILQEGDNPTADQIITLSKMSTTHYGTCYLIVSKIIGKDPGPIEVIKISVPSKPYKKKLPQLLIYFTSEMNSYGITRAFWKDGEVLSFYMNQNQRYMALGLKEERYHYLRDKSPCRDESYSHCIGSQLVKADFQECPMKCLAHSVPKTVDVEEKIPICKARSIAWKCSHKYGLNLIRKLRENATCLERACKTTHYDGKIVFQESHPQSPLVHPDSRSFSYTFLHTSVAIHEEYLIYDFVGMLGSIGGTLGMCIGFSFVSLSSVLLFYLQMLIVYLRNYQ